MQVELPTRSRVVGLLGSGGQAEAALAPGAPERKELYARAASMVAPERKELYARAASMVGAFADRDGATDVSAEHDRYLTEAYS
jgi:hypothetical protein